MSPDQRRAHFEAEICRYALTAKEIDHLTHQDLLALSNKETLVAYANGSLIHSIRICRKYPRHDAYHGVKDIIYAMSDLSGRACYLSARQLGIILDRDERAIRRSLQRLCDDGVIIKGEPQGRYGVVPHYPSIHDSFISNASPTWIINAFVPGLFANGVDGKSEYSQQVTGTPDVDVTPGTNITHDVDATPDVNVTPTPDVDVTPKGKRPDVDITPPLTCTSATPDVDVTQRHLNKSLEVNLKDSPSLRSGSALVKVADALELELVAEGDEFGQEPDKKQSNRKPHDPKKKGPLIAHIEGLRESKALHNVIMRVADEHGGEAAGWTEQHIADLKKKWANKWLVTKKAQTAAEWVLLFEAFCLENYNQPRRPFGNSKFPTATEIKQQDKDFLASLRKR